MIKLNGMQHIGVYLTDARAAADWYEKNLGFKRLATFTTSGGNEVIFIRSDAVGTTYELVGQVPGTPGYDAVKDGKALIDHIAYTVDNVEAAYEQAKQDGLEIISEITNIPEFWDNGFRYFMVKGPCGEKVEFCKIL